ncbi:MAG: tyrosinase family protein [Elusimicrobiota bacterium]|nr:tyrosinase family protein [Elusimicrobiota bacterium]
MRARGLVLCSVLTLLSGPDARAEDIVGQVTGAGRVALARMMPARVEPSRWDPDMTYTEGLGRIGLAVPVIRRSILDPRYDADDRRELAAAMRDFLTPAIVEEHYCGVSHVAERLFTHHDRYILQLEMYLADQGLSRFLPLPYWEAGGPIPPEFTTPVGRAEEVRLPEGFYRLIQAKPDQFRFPEVCRYNTDQELARAIDGWHGGVHSTLGGCMGDFRTASATPLFWLWHAYVSQTREEWKRCPGVNPSTYNPAPAGTRPPLGCRP